MPERIYMLANSAQASSAAPVAQPTNAVITTMLQIGCSAINSMTILEWGISFNGSAAATPIKCELFSCTGAATMSTASVLADVNNSKGMNDANAHGSDLYLGATSRTGFATTTVTEGTAANYSLFDLQFVAPTNQYWKQWPLGREPVVAAANTNFVRVRVTAGASVSCYCYVVWSE